jgi:fission process protein 1
MPWWGKSQDSKPEPQQAQTEAQAQHPRPPSNDKNAATSPLSKDFNPDKLPDREKLPKALQSIVDKADEDGGFFDKIVEG